MKASTKKTKEAFVIIEQICENGVILSTVVADTLPKAVLYLKDRFEEEQLSARITQQSAGLLPAVVADYDPVMCGEREFFFSNHGIKKKLRILSCAKV